MWFLDIIYVFWYYGGQAQWSGHGWSRSSKWNFKISSCLFYVFLNLVEYLSAIFILILWGPGAVDRRAGAGRCCWSSGTVVAWSRGARSWSKTETHSSGRRQSSKCTSVTKPTSLPRKENSCWKLWQPVTRWARVRSELWGFWERWLSTAPLVTASTSRLAFSPKLFFQDRGAYWMICIAWNVKGKRSERKDIGVQDVVWVS